jgi:hypothetical protein
MNTPSNSWVPLSTCRPETPRGNPLGLRRRNGRDAGGVLEEAGIEEKEEDGEEELSARHQR